MTAADDLAAAQAALDAAAAALDIEGVMRARNDVLDAQSRLEDAAARAAGGPHIRARRLGSAWGTDSVGFRRRVGYEPHAETMCGAPATTVDLRYGDVRGERSAGHIACPDCRRLRLSDLAHDAAVREARKARKAAS